MGIIPKKVIVIIVMELIMISVIPIQVRDHGVAIQIRLAVAILIPGNSGKFFHAFSNIHFENQGSVAGIMAEPTNGIFRKGDNVVSCVISSR